MRVLSLFSGGGLGDYGLTLAGMEIVGQVEIDDYCQKILKLRWPDVPKWTDIKNVRGEEVLKRCGTVDLISGGFPCQPFSVAGTREGENDSRHLWPEMSRIIREIRPRWVLAENVPGLLSISDGWVFGEVVRDLAESGYCVEWDCIPASAVGAPHQRDRVWIVGYAEHLGRNGSENGKSDSERNDGDPQGKDEFRKSKRSSNARKNDVADTSSGGCKQRPNKSRKKCEEIGRSEPCFGGEALADTPSTRSEGYELQGQEKNGEVFSEKEFTLHRAPCSIRKSKWWRIEPNVGRVAHGVAKRVDRLKLLGNGQVVQVVEWIGKQIMRYDHSREENQVMRSEENGGCSQKEPKDA